RNSQPQTHTSGLGGKAWYKQIISNCVRNAFAVVFNGHDNAITSAANGNFYQSFTGYRNGLNGILNQVIEHSYELFTVCLYHYWNPRLIVKVNGHRARIAKQRSAALYLINQIHHFRLSTRHLSKFTELRGDGRETIDLFD